VQVTLTADSVLAFDDSDILAFAQDGRGGNITLNTPAYFGSNFQAASLDADPDTLDGNNRADINATGAVSGDITLPNVSFIQNSLVELPENAIDTASLIANSCVARSRDSEGTFIITGAGGLPLRPGDASVSSYSTGTVRTLSNEAPASSPETNRSWQQGDPIVEPQGVYRLPNGKLVMSRECS
jgi:large exoprotein involved in heme utilization and adhesion